MKKRRTMLLCVTATSMAAAVACEPASHPVGMVSRPPSAEREAATDDTSDHVNASPDAGAPIVVGEVAQPPDVAPRVGTTAQVPDKKK